MQQFITKITQVSESTHSKIKVSFFIVYLYIPSVSQILEVNFRPVAIGWSHVSGLDYSFVLCSTQMLLEFNQSFFPSTGETQIYRPKPNLTFKSQNFTATQVFRRNPE